MENFKFNIGDLLKVNGDTCVSICMCHTSKEYTDNLRVTYRFWCEEENVYVIATEDGFETVVRERDVVLQEAAKDAVPGVTDNVNERNYIDADLKASLLRLGIIPDEVRGRNVGASDYSKHIIQPWAIWQEYHLTRSMPTSSSACCATRPPIRAAWTTRRSFTSARSASDR